APFVQHNSPVVTTPCAALGVSTAADAARVELGSPIGFTITVANGSQATLAATATTLSVGLPAPGEPFSTPVTWTISPAYAGPGTCSVLGDRGNQTLSCAPGDLAPGTSATVHVVAQTTRGNCATYSVTPIATTTSPGPTPSPASVSMTVPCAIVAISQVP